MKFKHLLSTIFLAFLLTATASSVLFCEEMEDAPVKKMKRISYAQEFTLAENESVQLEKMKITFEKDPYYILAEEHEDKIRIEPKESNRYTRFHDYVIVFLKKTLIETEVPAPDEPDDTDKNIYFLFKPEKEDIIITSIEVDLKILHSKLESKILEWEAMETALETVAEKYLPKTPEVAAMIEERQLPISTGRRKLIPSDSKNKPDEATWEIEVPFYDNLYIVSIDAATGDVKETKTIRIEPKTEPLEQ